MSCSIALPATTASAATLVGYPIADAVPQYGNAGGMVTQRRNSDVGGSTYPGFSTGGVLTSISIRTRDSAATISVSIIRKTGEPSGDTATFLAVAGAEIPVTADGASVGHVTSVPIRVPVSAGDRFAATTATVGAAYLTKITAAEDNYCFYSTEGSHPVGNSLNYFSAACHNFIPLVEGTVEADADGDLYGDETQDFCPGDATRQSCPTVVPPLPANLVMTAVKSKASPGSTATRKFKIKNIGATVAAPATITLSSSKKIKKFIFLRGCKAAKGGRSCKIANLDPGASVTIKVKVTPKASTSTKLTAKVKTPGETATSDNSASMKVKFRPKK